MVDEQQSGQGSRERRRMHGLAGLGIRSKIIIPYLVLTLAVAVAGVYFVMVLVAGSLDERLNNHLLEAGRVVSDSMVYQEVEHLESARLVAFTRGLAEALRDGEDVTQIAQTAAAAAGTELIILIDSDGHEVLHIVQQSDGSQQIREGETGTTALWVAQELLASGNIEAAPRRGMGLYPADQRYYYLSAIPVVLDEEMVGVVVVGTSLDTLIPFLKDTSLADVTIYIDQGRAVASSYELSDEGVDTDTLLETLSLSADEYENYLQAEDLTIIKNVYVRQRKYRMAHGSLRMGNDVLGVYSVALRSDYIVERSATSRDRYLPLFIGAMACVIVVGYLISQRITNPLARLVRTSRAVAEGDLEQRTGIAGTDEVGVLAATFDEMTGKLAERTRELERLLQAQKEAAGRMRAILSSIGDGVILEDVEGDFIPLNATAEAMLEDMASDFMHGPLRELFGGPAEEIGGADDQVNPWLLESRRFQVGMNVLSTHTAAVRTDDGQRLGTVIVLRDVTAEVEAEQLKDSFIAHVSHELRTPLTAIRGYSGLLLSGPSGSMSEDQIGFLRTISRHTESLISMVNELLDFSELEAGRRLGLRKEPTSLPALVEEVADEWRTRMEDKGLELLVSLPDDMPDVNVDDSRLRWALINMVRNAWQYTHSGQVSIRLYSGGGQAIFEIQDTGVGISPENHQRVFSRFYRVMHGPGTDDDVRGLGLGLYLTKAIVEAHDGQVRVDSEPGVGSTFTVTIPMV